MLGAPSDSSLSIRTVEWLRDSGARGLVNRIESIYDSLNAPALPGEGAWWATFWAAGTDSCS